MSTAPTPRWRVMLHALDRTGPPMLARGLLRNIRSSRPEVMLDVVAFRGGEMLSEFEELAPTMVMLRDHEPWDHQAPDPLRVAALSELTASLPQADAVLLVSISAGQCVEYLHHENSPVLAWVVEQGEDLHWLGPPLQLAQRVDHLLAGSATTAEELRTILPATTNITVCPEFVERPSAVDPAEVENRRAELMVAPPELAPANSGSHPIPDSQSPAMLVVGAGIGTWRKAPDLFLEVAASAERSGHGDTYVWIGGQNDDLHPKVAAEGDRLGLRRFVMAPSVPDLTNSLASADVFLHTARLDAFPLVCLHSILAGTPVVAFSGAGGVPEMLGSSFCGAEYPDLAGLSAAVEQLRDPSKRAAVAHAQLAYVSERFTADHAGSALIDAIDSATVATPAEDKGSQ